MTDHWLDDPSPYLDRDDPRCRRYPHELGTWRIDDVATDRSGAYPRIVATLRRVWA